MSSRPQSGCRAPIHRPPSGSSLHTRYLACGMAAGFVWLDLARSSTCLRHDGRLERERFVRLESSTLERSGSLSLNYDGVVGRKRCATPRHRPSRLDLIRFENRARARESLGSRDSQRRGLAGARAPDNPLTIYTDRCYRLKLICTQIIVGTNRHSNGEPRPSHRR